MEVKERTETQCGHKELPGNQCVFPHCARCPLNDTTERDILNWMVEGVHDEPFKTKRDFWSIYNSKTSAAWGWSEAEKVAGQRVVWLYFSPETKDDKSRVVYNYISEAEFQLGEPTN